MAKETSARNVALIIGGTGLAGGEIASTILNAEEKWSRVILLSRSTVPKNVFGDNLSVDFTPIEGVSLSDQSSILKALEKVSYGITHVFWFVDASHVHSTFFPTVARFFIHYAALVSGSVHPILPNFIRNEIITFAGVAAGSGSSKTNILWLQNLFEALRAVNAPLERFVLGTGAKHYGMHLGPTLWPSFKLPFRENMKCPGKLSYFDMEDYIASRAEKENFGYNIIRPGFILGRPPRLRKNMQNIGVTLAVYCTILKARGQGLIFPGSYQVYHTAQHLTTSKQIARIAVWASTGGKRTHNEAYNSVSTVPFLWKKAWEDIAAYFGMEVIAPQPGNIVGVPCSYALGRREDCSDLWNQLVAQYGLKNHPFEEVFNELFLDKSFSFPWSSVFSVQKLKDHGFEEVHEASNASILFSEFFDLLVNQKIIPSPKTARTFPVVKCIQTKDSRRHQFFPLLFALFSLLWFSFYILS
mmetsp:Transcript_14183/g.17212  ORF Transcript_14183/g.17212 Transcript_14183/m.17212 type:complete len:471 (-) Transcript_14183:36-1448(-)